MGGEALKEKFFMRGFPEGTTLSGKTFHKEIFRELGTFPGEVGLPILFKKPSEIKYYIFFTTESKEQQ